MELKHLRALDAIRRRRTMALAAKDLFVTQSALSHMIRELENVLGMPVLVRSTKPMSFAPAGERLLRLADSTLPIVDEAMSELRDMGQGSTRRIHLCIECHSCYDWLLPALDRFRVLHPTCDVDLKIGASFDPYPALEQRLVDVVFLADKFQAPWVSFLPVFRYEVLLVVAPAHRLAQKGFVEPADLSRELVVSYPVAEERLDFFRRFLHPAGIRPERIQHAELTWSIVQEARAGRAVAALPSWAIARELEAKDLVGLKLGPGGIHCELFAAVRREDASENMVGEFVAETRELALRMLPGVYPVST